MVKNAKLRRFTTINDSENNSIWQVFEKTRIDEAGAR
jgi:hypothetical protein